MNRRRFLRLARNAAAAVMVDGTSLLGMVPRKASLPRYLYSSNWHDAILTGGSQEWIEAVSVALRRAFEPTLIAWINSETANGSPQITEERTP